VPPTVPFFASMVVMLLALFVVETVSSTDTLCDTKSVSSRRTRIWVL
jgi:hypothetical protein